MATNTSIKPGRPDGGIPCVEPARAAFEHAPIGLAVIAPDGAWLAINECISRIFGYSQDELSHLTARDITHPDDYEADEAQFKRILAGEIDGYEIDKRYICKDGSVIWGHLTVSAVRDERTGRPQCFVGAVEETTARQRDEHPSNSLRS
ncbi:MAG TPA: PAS domain S-box protein [Capsulimonadaceae bacterium]|nr:PAS domain S-box protein [Capsulimonadaceae bacterium]